MEVGLDMRENIENWEKHAWSSLNLRVCNVSCETGKVAIDAVLCLYIWHKQNNSFPTTPLVPHLASAEPVQGGRMLPIGIIWVLMGPAQHRPAFPVAVAPEEADQQKYNRLEAGSSYCNCSIWSLAQ